MNKKELVDAMADAAGISKAEAEKALNGMLMAVSSALAKGDKVTLVGFGTFSTREREARTGRNPRTGEAVDVPSKRVPYFKPGKEMRERLNPE